MEDTAVMINVSVTEELETHAPVSCEFCDSPAEVRVVNIPCRCSWLCCETCRKDGEDAVEKAIYHPFFPYLSTTFWCSKCNKPNDPRSHEVYPV